MNVQSDLKKLAFSSSIWVMIDTVIGQGLRFVSNVILTRLLAPEVFGLMGIVSAVLTGLSMFSDVGLKPSVIQNPRGEEPAFLRTAWTIQVIRGFLLSLAATLLAWPIALYYNEPSLVLLIAVAGVTAIVSGFESTWLLVLSRRMNIGKMTMLELAAYIVSLIVMVSCAWYFNSIWALVVGELTGAILILIFSHTLLAGLTMSFQWESSAVKELIHFGRWIFISTALTFLVSSLDVFILGSFGGLAVLGIYILAKNLSRLAITALLELSSTVLFPVYSRLSEQGFDTLRDKTLKTRALLLLVFLPPLWLMVFLGDDFIRLVYDDRYADAGWMLQILVAGSMAGAIMATISPVLLAVGNSFKNLIFTASQLGFQIIGMTVGAYVAGIEGFIIGIAIAEIFCYPVLVYLIHPYKVWLPMLDMIAFASSFIVVGLAFYL